MWCLTLFTSGIVAACLAGPYNGFRFPDHEFDKTPLGDAIDKVSINMLNEAYMESEEKNVITSPFGVMTLLSLYATGAPGPVRDEIVAALGASDYSELFTSYSNLSQKFANISPSYLTLANKIYVSDTYRVQDGFERKVMQSYRSEVEKISFDDKKAAADAINQWAEEKTHGHIKNSVPDDAIDSSIAAALFNVIFFQGQWGVKFDADKTKEEDFHLSKDQTVKKPMMHLVSPMFYQDSEKLDAKLIELPYKEPGFRMVVVLPNEVDGLPEVLKKVEQHGLLSDVFELSPAFVRIDVKLPKFTVDSTVDLNSLLPKLGITKIFTDGASEIVENNSVLVSKAFQKAFVKVDEEGSTAGSFTGALATPTSSLYVPPPPMKYHADHPFLYAILHEDKILFIGTYTH